MAAASNLHFASSVATTLCVSIKIYTCIYCLETYRYFVVPRNVKKHTHSRFVFVGHCSWGITTACFPIARTNRRHCARCRLASWPRDQFWSISFFFSWKPFYPSTRGVHNKSVWKTMWPLLFEPFTPFYPGPIVSWPYAPSSGTTLFLFFPTHRRPCRVFSFGFFCFRTLVGNLCFFFLLIQPSQGHGTGSN